MIFRRADRERVARGEITVSYRLWRAAKVKAGKSYRTPLGTIAVDDVQVIPAAMIARRDVRLTGCKSIAEIRELAGEHTKTRVDDDTLLHRVQFRFLGDEAPTPKPTRTLDLDEIATRLARIDQRSPRGAWTHAVLRAIQTQPQIPARILCAQLDWERLDFKVHVRKLKALGLTISHEVGYELSVLGRRYLASLTSENLAINKPSPRRGEGGRRPGEVRCCREGVDLVAYRCKSRHRAELKLRGYWRCQRYSGDLDRAAWSPTSSPRSPVRRPCAALAPRLEPGPPG